MKSWRFAMVSIRAPLRRATSGAARSRHRPGGFNPRPPAESDASCSWTTRRPSGFNPRPPAESDGRRGSADGQDRVSIRAPLRRATERLLQERPGAHVSIRAPLRRATCYEVLLCSHGRFQSAPPCGERLLAAKRPQAVASFNPRPPAESDQRGSQKPSSSWRFQSAPPCGERRVMFLDNPATEWFQSAPPCGERRTAWFCRRARSGFNPRPPAESDRAPSPRAPGRSRFNPRPPAESDML